MTAQEMQYNFELKAGTLNGTRKPFSSTDIAILLNKSQDLIIQDRYSSKVISARHFEMDEKTRQELGVLVKNYLSTTFATGANRITTDSVFVALPSDYLYSLNEKCVVSYSNCNGVTTTSDAMVQPVTHDEYLRNRDNPFNKPYEKLIWRMDYGGDVAGTKKHELIHKNGQSITSYNLRYLRRPAVINIITGVACELHPELHEEIVDRAVEMALRIKMDVEQTSQQ